MKEKLKKVLDNITFPNITKDNVHILEELLRQDSYGNADVCPACKNAGSNERSLKCGSCVLAFTFNDCKLSVTFNSTTTEYKYDCVDLICELGIDIKNTDTVKEVLKLGIEYFKENSDVFSKTTD